MHVVLIDRVSYVVIAIEQGNSLINNISIEYLSRSSNLSPECRTDSTSEYKLFDREMIVRFHGELETRRK